MDLVPPRPHPYSAAVFDSSRRSLAMPTPIAVLLDPITPAVTAIFAALVGWEADAVATPRPPGVTHD